MNSAAVLGPETNALSSNLGEPLGTPQQQQQQKQHKGDASNGTEAGTGFVKQEPSGDQLEGDAPTRVSDEDFIKRIVSKTVQDTIKDDPYSHDATNRWTNDIVETLVRSLVQIDRDNKYIGGFSAVKTKFFSFLIPFVCI